ncbi:porin family protein [Capnocytophaga sp.]|uniref:porin family protein n=1 Tax=Capnocytophaga sp. TaxID=44737 RepID=UPI0026DC98FE|nr:porin family protein [Capnocytophaga sp.]MDO5105091.1 porin family protein [Capnocytophaga sp.]
MKRINLLILLLAVFPAWLSAQEDADDGMIQTQTEKKDERSRHGRLYLEDQFYVGLTYDYLISDAANVVQHNFSRGLHGGFLRDIPMNERRNMGIAIGLGYSYDLVYSNIVALSEDNIVSYYVPKNLNDLNISKNYFETHTVELPLEFRWRTSTAQSHKFWRVYGGVKLGYVFSGLSLFKRNEITYSFNNSDVYKQWHFKTYLTFGYNTWNFFIQYNMSPFFKDAQTAAEKHSLKSSLLQMGLMFYIL